MYALYDREGEETVVRALMGANDDGGQGFNARLFLVNFPGDEYLIAVSGSPNPSPVGTFIVSLTDVSEDDYSADESRAGALPVGGSADGRLEAPGDVDWFAVDLSANTTYRIQVTGAGSNGDSLEQPRLKGIYDGGGLLIPGAGNLDDGGSGARTTNVEFTPLSDGAHYIAVAGISPYLPNRSSTLTGAYRLGVEAVP